MKTLLVLGHLWPEPDSSAAGTRMLQLLYLFNEEGFKIVFASTASRSPFSKLPVDLEIETVAIKLNDPSFDDLLKEIKPDVALFDRFMTEEQFGWRLDKFAPDCLKILDTEDLHFLREARQKAYKAGKVAAGFYPTSDLAKREVAAIYRCDLSLIISEAEMQILTHEFGVPGNLLLYLPFLLGKITPLETQKLPGFEDRKDFISIGNFLHAPNRNAVLELKEKIWPGIRKSLPNACLHIFGAYASQKDLELHNTQQGFLVHGRAHNARSVMKKARVCLAPLQFGAGLKGKLILAMQCGTPCITTSLGAEAMAGDLPWNGFIENQPKDFTDAAVRLYRDKELWQDAKQKGFNIINQRFFAGIFKEKFRKTLKEKLEYLEDHRARNFTGAMLKHHLHRSTYFMARFIEEKNKNKD